MLDFLQIKHGHDPKGHMNVFPDFRVGRSKDLMIQGEKFYAIWDQTKGLWSTDQYDVQILVDEELSKYADNLRKSFEGQVKVKYMADFSSGSWSKFLTFIAKLSDQFKQLDTKVVFSNDNVLKKDYISKRLSYPMEETPTPAFDELLDTLYDKENKHKIMWSIGSIVDGGSKKIQKLFVLFGAPGTGKSTVLNIIQSLFPGYYTNFEAKSLTSSNTTFAAESFRDNPLIGINHEAELSRVKDNSLLNSIVAHDPILMNVKYKSGYPMRLNAMLFAATNKPVNITDSNSGLLRRLIDIRPTGKKLSSDRYDTLVAQLEFELSGIVHKCLNVYREAGRAYYNQYRPVDMLMRTNTFANFVDSYFFEFDRSEHVTLKRAWDMYKQYCEDANIEYKLPRHRFRDELKTYFRGWEEVKRVSGKQLRSVYYDFDTSKFNGHKIEELKPEKVIVDEWLELKKQGSLFDDVLKDCKAQYGSRMKYWKSVTTKTSDLNTKKLHHVLPPKNLITIDFDIKDSTGNKSETLNIVAAKKFPKTYAESSKGESGLHLQYYYDGDISKLSRIFDVDIEVLVPTGDFSIRRKLTRCNSEPIATISSGLPLKGDRAKMLSKSTIKSERTLRSLVLQNINKEIHHNTKPSIDFIHKLLTEANASDLVYDLSDLKTMIIDFASKSTNQAEYCMKVALDLPYESDNDHPGDVPPDNHEGRFVFFDIEVFMNLIIICWKYAGDSNIVRMINPSPSDVELLLKQNLIGYNNRRYDNHILWAILLGMNNEQVYNISSRIVSGDRSVMFREAYRLSYSDVFDISSDKKSLKKWQIELGLPHKEMDHPWDVPLPEERWEEAVEYCDNDVVSTEYVFDHILPDFNARKILAGLSTLPVNDGTLSHMKKFIFGDVREPQSTFVYPDLSKTFPGYKFIFPGSNDHREAIESALDEKEEKILKTIKKPFSLYRGEIASEGGYVWAKPGIYENVLYVDVDSMHPNSMVQMNLFGEYTKKFNNLLDAKGLLKLGKLEEVGKLFGGKFKPYLSGDISSLTKAVKLMLNQTYGYTYAGFPNAFRDPRNKDNVVAKRGALFMIDLKNALIENGIECIHFKTDSVKIANYKPSDVEFIKEFGKKYGYTFSIECVYKKMALINDSVLIALTDDGRWDAVGARFAKPYVYKSLFSKEPITAKDMVEVRQVVKGLMYIDIDGKRSFVGRIGAFHPMTFNGGDLLRVDGEKAHAVTDTKGYKWLEAETVKQLGYEKMIDTSYFEKATKEAVEKISEVGDIRLMVDRQTLESLGY